MRRQTRYASRGIRRKRCARSGSESVRPDEGPLHFQAVRTEHVRRSVGGVWIASGLPCARRRTRPRHARLPVQCGLAVTVARSSHFDSIRWPRHSHERSHSPGFPLPAWSQAPDCNARISATSESSFTPFLTGYFPVSSTTCPVPEPPLTSPRVMLNDREALMIKRPQMALFRTSPVQARNGLVAFTCEPDMTLELAWSPY
jgi:hypothetical protein